MAGLRDEIIESQKVRSELLKWKLLVVSALGATGLGFTEHTGTHGAYLVILLIPLACFYVDLLCRHLSLRIIVIGSYLRMDSGNTAAAYEHFVTKTASMGDKKLNVFALEEWALEGSTFVLSSLVFIAGLVPPEVQTESEFLRIGDICLRVSYVAQAVFVASGLAGIVLTFVSRSRYRSRRDAVIDLTRDAGLNKELKAMAAQKAI